MRRNRSLAWRCRQTKRWHGNFIRTGKKHAAKSHSTQHRMSAHSVGTQLGKRSVESSHGSPKSVVHDWSRFLFLFMGNTVACNLRALPCNLHVFDAGLPDALGYFRPDFLVVFAILSDQLGIVLKIEGETEAAGHWAVLKRGSPRRLDPTKP